jgi:hypothetical protein
MHNGAWSNTVTLPRPKGGSNREYKADLPTGGVLPTRLGKEVKMIHGCTHNLFKDNFFSDYIERIQRWAAQDLGVVIPDPPRIDIQ